MAGKNTVEYLLFFDDMYKGLMMSIICPAMWFKGKKEILRNCP